MARAMRDKSKKLKNGKKSRAAKRQPAASKPGIRDRAPGVLAQGVGAVPRKPYGSSDCSRRMTLACWDAKSQVHLGLPRPVGPYTTVRVTRRFTSPSAALLFGTFKYDTAHPGSVQSGKWSNMVCTEAVNPADPINASANSVKVSSPLTFLSAGTSGATCVPSAFTVQILNPEALQTTTGIVYAGVMNTQAMIGGRTESWTDYFNRFVNFQSPRLLSAAKLALKGVQISSYPLDMTEISDFTQLQQETDGPHAMNNDAPEPRGWTPIMVMNPDAVRLEYLVTTEWRVRFDLQNPASAGHQYHPMQTDSTWNEMTKRAVALGNGVRDIAEVVADFGIAARYLAPVI